MGNVYVIKHTGIEQFDVFVRIVNGSMFARRRMAHATTFPSLAKAQDEIDSRLLMFQDEKWKFHVLKIPKQVYFKERLMYGEDDNE